MEGGVGGLNGKSTMSVLTVLMFKADRLADRLADKIVLQCGQGK